MTSNRAGTKTDGATGHGLTVVILIVGLQRVQQLAEKQAMFH